MAKTAPTGEYLGKPSSPDSVKKTVQYGGLTIKVDRPKGFIMRGTDDKGKPWTREYKYDYGFLPRTNGGDGDGVDVFIGPIKDDEEVYWARKTNRDGSFDEYKVFVGFGSVSAAKKAFGEHIPMSMFDGIATMKVGLMQAMLGLEPDEKVAQAMQLGFFDELGKLEKNSGLKDLLTKEIPNTPTWFMGRGGSTASTAISKGKDVLKPLGQKTRQVSPGVHQISESMARQYGVA